MERLPISKITVDSKIQSRELINKEVVAEYAEGVKNGDSFPPVVVFFDGIDYWLADGFHRIYAYKLAEVAEIDCDVREGTFDDAVECSAGANAKHGLRRTNADKRKSVLMVFNLPKWQKKLQEEIKPNFSAIARVCGVDHVTVSNIISPLLTCENHRLKTEVETKDGRKYTIDTSNYGKSKPTESQFESEPEEKTYSLHCIADDPEYMNCPGKTIEQI